MIIIDDQDWPTPHFSVSAGIKACKRNATEARKYPGCGDCAGGITPCRRQSMAGWEASPSYGSPLVHPFTSKGPLPVMAPPRDLRSKLPITGGWQELLDFSGLDGRSPRRGADI
jgi:hypothetical protein